MTDHPDPSRRGALKCLAFGGAGRSSHYPAAFSHLWRWHKAR